MATQIKNGTEFVTGDQVTAANLEALVSNASLLPGAITEQTTATSVAGTDQLLIASGGLLKKATATVLHTGLVKTDGSVPMTGELTLSTSNPTAASKAASKGYVDGKVAGFVPTAGGTVTGNLEIQGQLTASSSTLSCNFQKVAVIQSLTAPYPASTSDAATKQYVDDQINISGVKAKLSFSGVTPEYNASGNVPKTSKYITVNVSRTLGSTTATISFASLSAAYKSTTTPFFIAGQFIGVNSGFTGLNDQLYKIESVNTTTNTFTIITAETTALNQSITLSCLFDCNNTSGYDDLWSKNIKSVYFDSSSRKHYFNFRSDIFTGEAEPASVYQARDVNLTGQLIRDEYVYNCVIMQDAGRTTYIQNPNVPEGYGATNMGCHVGYFLNYNAGISTTYFTSANVAFL